jgi:two-component system, OmpR family, sensor histidine kinase MtrB
VNSLRARLLLAFGALGLAILIGLGSALFIVLRGLEHDAADGALTDTAVQLVTVARARLAANVQGRVVLADMETALQPLGISLLLADGQGTVLASTGDTPPARVDLTRPGLRGTLAHGTYRVSGRQYLFVAVTVAGPATSTGTRVLVLARPDTSAGAALGDLARALVVALLVVLVVGGLLATALARSIARPLERLAAATSHVSRGDLPAPLPVEGPAEVAHASASFNVMSAEVAHARQAQRDLVANVRHDLRTPVTVIGGFAQALQDGTATGADAERAAAAIVEETARLERMVEGLADLSDLEAGGRALRLEQLDASELVRTTVVRFAPSAEAVGQRVSGPGDAVAIPFVADRSAAERMLGNLVRNALAAAPSPGGQVRLEAAALPAGSVLSGPAVLLAVRDDGPGIPADALPRVFDRFFRADPARRGPGSGLGLAIVAELARAHGGRAFAENAPGGGARVGVVLPAMPAATASS